MNTLRQKQWPEFKYFAIEDTGLRFETRQDDQFVNTLIEFDQIGTKEVIVNQKTNPYGVIPPLSREMKFDEVNPFARELPAFSNAPATQAIGTVK